jgi:uncharacterized protein YecT (DUF1311 family)
MFLPLFLLLGVAADPTPSGLPPATPCDNPDPDDARPYTLCLAEADFEQSEALLQRQWAITLTRVRDRKGVSAARRLSAEQRSWVLRRDRECEALAGASPATQSGRNQMGCLAQLTDERTAQLKAVVKTK